MAQGVRTKVFWSGGSQAIRVPKDLRLESSEVIIHRKGRRLIVEPEKEDDGWGGFWDRLLTLRAPVVRHPTRPGEKRKPI